MTGRDAVRPGHGDDSGKQPQEPVPPIAAPGARMPRRVSVTMDGDLYVAFRTFVVENGLTGEQALRMAVRRLIEEGLR